jgi:hypothetical protein
VGSFETFPDKGLPVHLEAIWALGGEPYSHRHQFLMLLRDGPICQGGLLESLKARHCLGYRLTIIKESAHYFERYEHSWSADSSVIAPRIAGLHLSTQGLGKPEFQEIEEIQMSCRKISADKRSANLPLKPLRTPRFSFCAEGWFQIWVERDNLALREVDA